MNLYIRHASKLWLREVKWKVANADFEYLIIGRPVLQSIACDNKAIPAAVCDQNDGVLNIPKALIADARKKDEDVEANGTIAAMMRGVVFHSSANEGDDGLEDSNGNIDLGEDEPQEVKNALKNLVKEAEKNGMSQGGTTHLSELLMEFKSVFD